MNDADEGEDKTIEQRLSEHDELIQELETVMGYIKKRLLKKIATLQASLNDAHTDSRQQKDRVERLVEGSNEKDKRIEELEEQRSVSLNQINTLGAKFKSAEEELAKVKGKDGLNVNN